jgi:hypothetical protein
MLDHMDAVIMHQLAFPDPDFDPTPGLRLVLGSVVAAGTGRTLGSPTALGLTHPMRAILQLWPPNCTLNSVMSTATTARSAAGVGRGGAAAGWGWGWGWGWGVGVGGTVS